MPLLGKKSFKLNPLPKDLKSTEEVFVIEETNEVFRSYDEYVNRIILYGFQVWSCELTGKTNLKYGEAVTCEEQALKRLQGFPKYLEKPVLQFVHHNTGALQPLVQQCLKQLKKEFVVDEPVECCVVGKWHQGRVSSISHGNTSGDAEATYDIECDAVQDCLKDVPSGDIKRVKKLPSEEMLKCFIRANTENPWRNDNTPWVVKSEMAKKYSLVDKLKDFSLVLNKIKSPSSKTPTKGNKSSEKPKKKAHNESAGHGKSRVNKTDTSQRKLDCFTSKNSKTEQLLNKVTPAKKDIVDICSSPEKDDDKTPSGQLRGTPIKCRLMLTPVKSPCRGGSTRSPAQKKSGETDGAEKKKKNVKSEDNTNDVIITDCKSSKTNSSKKLKSSPKTAKSKKAPGDTEEPKKKHAKEGNVSKKLDLSKSTTDNSTMEKKLTKGAESKKKKAKIPKPAALVQKGDLVNVNSDSDMDFVSSPQKLAGKQKQSSGKMKQMTLLDLTKKPEDDKAAQLSPKMKAKKQKTLSEMFSSSFHKDKPLQATNAVMKKTQQEPSSSSLAINLHTAHQDPLSEKLKAHKDKLMQKQLSKETRRLNRHLMRQKFEDKDVLNSKPLPPATPVDMPSGITAETFGDIAMVADFVHTFRHLLLPRESLHVSIDNLSQALVTSEEGFPLLSKILFIFLQILLQDRGTKGEELGMQLSEMPLTEQTASEVSRLYLSSKLKILTSYEDDKQLREILESLQCEDFYTLTPEEKTKVLVTLCHEVLSSDAMDNYIESQLSEATKLRKQKMAKQKAKNDKIREEKERKKKEKEEMEKQKEEEENRKQPKMDELGKKETGSESTNPENTNVSPGTETSNKSEDCKIEEKKTANEKKEIPTKDQDKEVSEVVKALRKRREDMATKDEKKLEKEKERLEEYNSQLEKQEEEDWNMNMAHCKYTLRLKPIGCDRNHARYWVFNGAAAGVFVEQGWWNLEDHSQTAEESNKESEEAKGIDEVTMETDNKQKANEVDNDVEMVGEVNVENKMDSVKDSLPEWRLPDISYEWSCYSTVEEVQTLIDHLLHQGIRESALKKSLKEELPVITDGISKRKSTTNKNLSKLETGEAGPFGSIKEELKDTAERLVYGNLAVLEKGLEEYQNVVDQASTISELACQLEKLLPAVLPQFFEGLFTKDKRGAEKAKQRWIDEVKQAATVSRLHLMLGILDSTVIWDLSAENARCKICRLKGVNRTLILCDDCNLAYHLQCLRPALSEVPEGHWSCPACKPNERQSSRSNAKNYKEESGSDNDDGEASDAGVDSEDSSEEESDHHEDYCHICREDGDLICCDTCPLVFHTDCHQPPLRNIPRGAWSCWQCRQPKNKKQKKNQRGGRTTKSKEAKNKAVKSGRRGESSLRSGKLKRPHTQSSEESGNETVSKRTRQSCQPIADKKSARDKRSKARACIEDASDEESIDGKRKTKQRAGKVGTRISSRLQRMMHQQDSDDEEEGKADKSNARSFYGKQSRRIRQQKVSSEEEEEEDDDDEEPEEQSTRTTRARSNRPQISDDSEDEDDDDDSEKENHQSSRRKTADRSKSSERSTRKSTRNQRHVPSSPEQSEDSDEDTSQLTSQRAARKKNNKRAKNVISSDEESEESGHNNTRRPALRESNKGRTTRKGRRGDKIEEVESDDDKVKNKSNDKKEKREERKNSSVTKDGQRQARSTQRTEVLQEETKRRRVNVEMDTCEEILRDLLLHEDSWPFTEPVNLRQVPDYLELVTTPMDLGTIKDKLRSLEYPDVDSFVADVRLVFTNSDMYNVGSSDVGQAGKNLEKYFDKLYKENFSNTKKTSKVQRKR